MNRYARFVSYFVMLLASAALNAKAQTVRIEVTGGALSEPMALTAQDRVERFWIWSGQGVQVNSQRDPSPGTFIDWSRGTVAKAPADLQRYEVSFFCESRRTEGHRLAYAVSYVLDPATGHGYIYLPGRGDERYRLNTSSIYHGVEGNWFHASESWDALMRSRLRS